jgi:ubiquitin thioesterase protein OTUB1
MSDLMDDQASYELQQELIRKEIELQPIIGDESNPSILLSAYADATLKGFIPGIHYLNNKYKSLRKVRGDGNCFYRSFLFAYLETLLILNNSNDEKQKEKAQLERLRFINVIKNSTNDLVKLGYSEITFESFSDVSIY